MVTAKIEDLIDYYWGMMDFSTSGEGLTREELIDNITDELEIDRESVAEMVYRRVPSYEEGKVQYGD